MDTIALTINDKNVGCAAGTSILDAAAGHGIKIPTLCHHPDLKPHGACRMCLVEDEASGRLMASCVTPAADNMKIRTDSERVVRHRRNIVRLMVAEHPESCIVCSKGNRCRLRQAAADLGIGETHLYPMPNYKDFEQANPFIVRDLSKCILCGKCIRADHELVVVGAIDYNLRGFRSRPATLHEQALENSDCTFCGTCVTMCPTGALSTNDQNYVGTPEKAVDSVCGFCAVGCALELGVFGDKIVEINPADRTDSINRSTLCLRGHFANDFLNSRLRLVSPLQRNTDDPEGTQQIPIGWDPAIETVAERLKEIARTNGPQSIGFIGSAKASIEENYLLQKIARRAIGTNNLDYGNFVSGRAFQPIVDYRTAGRWRTARLSGLEDADVIFLIGADPSHSLPVVSYQIKRAVKAGVPLVVIDPRRTELAKMATYWVPAHPGSDATLINSLAAMLLAEGSYDAAFIEHYTEGFSMYRMGLSAMEPDQIAESAGINPEILRKIAGLLNGKKVTWLAGSGLSRQYNRSHAIDALMNLALMTGGWGQTGKAFFLLPKESNSVGAADMGVQPDFLPGRAPISKAESRRSWERAWGIQLSPDPGLSLPRMIEEAEKGRLKALYVMGENPLQAYPQQERVRSALEKIDFLVVQDILGGSTSVLADVVLPGAAFAEKSGTFVNFEGRIQPFTAAVSAPGLASPDWQILNLLYAALGIGKPYESLEQIRTEIADMIPMYADLKKSGAGWIKNSSEPAAEGPARPPVSFSPVTNHQDITAPDADHPYLGIFGTRRYHIGSGTRTGHSQRIRKHSPHVTVALCPADAAELELANGDWVQAFSASGSINCQIEVNSELPSGMVFIPLAVADNQAVNLLSLDFKDEPPETGRLTCPVGLKKMT